MANSIELQNAIDNAKKARKESDERIGIVSGGCYRMGRNGNMEPVGIKGLEVGARVIGILGLAGNESGTFYAYSLPDDLGNQKLVEDGFRHRFLFWNIFTDDRPISDQFGIGLYWDDEDPGVVKTADELARLYRACDIQERWNKRLKDNEERAHALRVANLKKKYKGVLVPLDSIKDWSQRAKQEKANLLALLKHDFPGVRFTAATAGHYRPTITWTDGPSEKEVEQVASNFVVPGHSRIDDYYETFPTAFTQTFGGWVSGFEYVRKYSEGYLQNLATQVEEAATKELLNWSGVAQQKPGFITSDAAGALMNAIEQNADRWNLKLSQNWRYNEGDFIYRRVANMWGDSRSYEDVAGYIAALIDLRPAKEEPKPHPKKEAKQVRPETTTTTTDEPPYRTIHLVEIPEGVAVVGDNAKATFYNRKAIKAHGATWNQEAQQWQATTPESITALRNWFATA